MKARLDVHFYVTPLCNLECRHCYYEAKSVDSDPGELLSAEEIYTAINNLCEDFNVDFHIEGGEAFLREDFSEILEGVLPDNRSMLTVTTSGSVLIDTSSQLLRELGNLRISVEGHTDELQNDIRKIPLKRVKRTMLQFSEEKVPVTARITLHSQNVEFWNEMISYYLQLGVKRFSFFELQEVGRGANLDKTFLMSDAQFDNLIDELCHANLDKNVEKIRFSFAPSRELAVINYKESLEKKEIWVRSSEVVPNLTINPNGDLGVSPWRVTADVVKDKIGSLREEDISSFVKRKIAEGVLVQSDDTNTSSIFLHYSSLG